MKLFLLILTIPLTIILVIKKIESGRGKSLRRLAGTAAVHGNAAHSLQNERMRIRKTNREKGVLGELGVAKDLERLAHEYGLTVLHDLSIPGSKANIDHVLVTSKVVYVIDAKNYTGMVKVAPNKEGIKTLRVGGRDQTLLVGKLKRYSDAVNTHLKSEGIQIKVVPLLAFYQAKFHDDSSVSVDGVTVNIFGIENELLRYANLKVEVHDTKDVAARILKNFPPKA